MSQPLADIETPVALGSYVRGRQDELDVSTKELCCLSGIDPSIYSKKTRGVFTFTPGDLIDVGEAFGEIIATRRSHQTSPTKKGPLAVSPAAARPLSERHS